MGVPEAGATPPPLPYSLFHALPSSRPLASRPVPQYVAGHSVFRGENDSMLSRVLENEVMDTAEEAAEYDAMDHREVNERFVTDFLAWVDSAGGIREGEVLDVGSGTAQIPIELARRTSSWSVTGVDLADSMLEMARRNVAHAGLSQRIRLERADAKALPYASGAFSAVISNSIMHHIPRPALALRAVWRVAAPGAAIFVRDLLRPASAASLAALVDRYAGAATPRQRELFAASLAAALSLDEVKALIHSLGGGDGVAATSDRHWTWRAIRTA